jgi:Tfp pilus assembly PilM family ATPase
MSLSLPFSKSQTHTAIDIDGQTLRLVRCSSRKGKTKVTHFAAERLEIEEGADSTDPQVMGRSIRAALSRLKLNPKSVVMGLPRGQVVLRQLLLPPTEDIHELASMVHFQIAKDLPFKKEEAVIDFKVEDACLETVRNDLQKDNGQASKSQDKAKKKESSQKLQVLVAAARIDIIKSYEEKAKAAGFALSHLGLRSYANARCVKACQPVSADEKVALVSLRPDEVVIDVLAQQSLAYSRVASVKQSAPDTEDSNSLEEEASKRDHKEDQLVNTIVIEVVRSLHSYESMEPRRKVAQVLIAGSAGFEHSVVSALAKRLKIPCRILNPAKALDITEADRKEATAAIAAFGLGFGIGDSEGLPFDFLNPKRPAEPKNPARLRILLAASAVFTLLFASVLVRGSLINKREGSVDEIRLELEDEKMRQKTVYRPTRLQAKNVDDWLKEKRNCLDHYAYISGILPGCKEVYVESLTINKKSIRLGLRAKDGQTLAEVDKKLRQAGYQLKPLPRTPSNNKYGYNFGTTVDITIPEKIAIDLSKIQTPPRPANDGSLDGAQL